MDITPYLLNDEAILHFIARGFYIVKTNVASEVHAQILQDAKCTYSATDQVYYPVLSAPLKPCHYQHSTDHY